MRIERIQDAMLVNADCLDWLRGVPECLRLGAVVTDPPYGIGFKYATHDDGDYGEAGYGSWLWERLSAAESRLAPGSPVFCWQAQQTQRHWHEWFPREWRVFVQAKNFVQMRNTVMQYAYDPVLVWWTDGDMWRADKETGLVNRDWYIANSAAAVSDTESLAKQHPCPRQVDVCEFLIANWVKPGDTCLDPFMGSATTGVACVTLGRKFIGVEADPKYFDLACRRIELAYKQRRLFDESPAPEQRAMV
jgi:DNA modification methylase